MLFPLKACILFLFSSICFLSRWGKSFPNEWRTCQPYANCRLPSCHLLFWINSDSKTMYAKYFGFRIAFNRKYSVPHTMKHEIQIVFWFPPALGKTKTQSPTQMITNTYWLTYIRYFYSVYAIRSVSHKGLEHFLNELAQDVIDRKPMVVAGYFGAWTS